MMRYTYNYCSTTDHFFIHVAIYLAIKSKTIFYIKFHTHKQYTQQHKCTHIYNWNVSTVLYLLHRFVLLTMWHGRLVCSSTCGRPCMPRRWPGSPAHAPHRYNKTANRGRGTMSLEDVVILIKAHLRRGLCGQTRFAINYIINQQFTWVWLKAGG